MSRREMTVNSMESVGMLKSCGTYRRQSHTNPVSERIRKKEQQQQNFITL